MGTIAKRKTHLTDDNASARSFGQGILFAIAFFGIVAFLGWYLFNRINPVL